MIGGGGPQGGGIGAVNPGCQVEGLGLAGLRGKIRMMFNFFFFFVCTMWHVGSYFPGQD